MYISESLQIYQKAAPTQVLSWEICEIFKNTYFEEHVQTTSSVSAKTLWAVGVSTFFKAIVKKTACEKKLVWLENQL